jgi:hypothetical protein
MRIDLRFEGGKRRGTRGNGRRRAAVASRGEERGRLEVGAILTGGPQLAVTEKEERGGAAGPAEEKLGRGKGVGPREACWAGGERRGRLGWWAEREGRS